MIKIKLLFITFSFIIINCFWLFNSNKFIKENCSNLFNITNNTFQIILLSYAGMIAYENLLLSNNEKNKKQTRNQQIQLQNQQIQLQNLINEKNRYELIRQKMINHVLTYGDNLQHVKEWRKMGGREFVNHKDVTNSRNKEDISMYENAIKITKSQIIECENDIKKFDIEINKLRKDLNIV